MAEKNPDLSLKALQVVYAALKDLAPTDRNKVLSSACTLLGIEGLPYTQQTITRDPTESRTVPTSTRPVSLIELLQEKRPGTNSQRIAMFAYYREKYEGISRFSRENLEPYFSKAKEPPSGNYPRDFVEAVKKGWIHEDGGDSYLTTKGVEAVESGFEGERKYSKVSKARPTTKHKAKRRAVKK